MASCHCPPFPLPHVCLQPFSINLSFQACLSNLVSVGGVTTRVPGALRLSSTRRALQSAQALPTANSRCCGPSQASSVPGGTFQALSSLIQVIKPNSFPWMRQAQLGRELRVRDAAMQCTTECNQNTNSFCLFLINLVFLPSASFPQQIPLVTDARVASPVC